MNKAPPQSKNELNDSMLDSLLEQHALQPPDDFVARVMNAVDEQETQAVHTSESDTQKLTWWQWLTLLLAGTPGVAQAFALVFSAWHISSAS